MMSGWDAHVNSARFRNADADGVMHFPGFHLEAAQMLMEEADVVGLAVDSLSLDHGISKDFAVHYAWLPSNRWGIEMHRQSGFTVSQRRNTDCRRTKIQGRHRRPKPTDGDGLRRVGRHRFLSVPICSTPQVYCKASNAPRPSCRRLWRRLARARKASKPDHRRFP